MKQIFIIITLSICTLGVAYAQSTDTNVYTLAEQMPEFDGDMYAYLSKNLNYPADARENGVQGKVIAQFIVHRDGSISNIVILKSPLASMSTEVIRVLQLMPNWKPGKNNGKPINVQVTLPVSFMLDDGKKKKK